MKVSIHNNFNNLMIVKHKIHIVNLSMDENVIDMVKFKTSNNYVFFDTKNKIKNLKKYNHMDVWLYIDVGYCILEFVRFSNLENIIVCKEICHKDLYKICEYRSSGNIKYRNKKYIKPTLDINTKYLPRYNFVMAYGEIDEHIINGMFVYINKSKKYKMYVGFFHFVLTALFIFHLLAKLLS